jgi:hypothetical protein
MMILVDLLYQYYVRHFPLSRTYLMHTVFQKLALLPSSGVRMKGFYIAGLLKSANSTNGTTHIYYTLLFSQVH